jgi:hypothetical protein
LATVERACGQRITAYQEFDRDVLVIKAGDLKMEIARSEIEDNRHLPKLRLFLEALMCAKVAGNAAPPAPSPSVIAMQREFEQALAVTQRAINENLYKREFQYLGLARLKEQEPELQQLTKPVWREPLSTPELELEEAPGAKPTLSEELEMAPDLEEAAQAALPEPVAPDLILD